jgi:hypothetical protein
LPPPQQNPVPSLTQSTSLGLVFRNIYTLSTNLLYLC